MARPKSNEKIIKHLKEMIEFATKKINMCVENQDYLLAEIHKDHRNGISKAIEILNPPNKENN
jgi:sugar-specific transcriptional regulator TrmB